MNESRGMEGEEAKHTHSCQGFQLLKRFGICVRAVSK